MKVYSVGKKSNERMKDLRDPEKMGAGSYAFLAVIVASLGVFAYDKFFVPSQTTSGVITQEIHWDPSVFGETYKSEGSFVVKVDTDQIKDVSARFRLKHSGAQFKQGDCVVGQLSTSRVLERHRMKDMNVVSCPPKTGPGAL